jgi:hypothetical protein
MPRRKFFELADVEAAARRKVRRHAPPVDLADRARGGAAHRRPVRHRARPSTVCRRAATCRPREHSAPLVAALEAWMRGERRKLSRHSDVAKAIDYMLKRWDAFARFLEDGRICLTNNAAERALRWPGARSQGLAVRGLRSRGASAPPSSTR